jgi:hypothetical protein
MSNEEVKITYTNHNHCLRCHALIEGAGGPGIPRPGDFSVCIFCANLMVFTEDLSLRQPTAAELEIAMKHQGVLETMALIKNLIRQRKARFN